MSNLIKEKQIHRIGSIKLDFLDFLLEHIRAIIISILDIAVVAVTTIATINKELNQLEQERHITISSSDGIEIFSYQGNFSIFEEDASVVEKKGLFSETKKYFKDIRIYNSQGTIFKARLDNDVVIMIEYINTESTDTESGGSNK